MSEAIRRAFFEDLATIVDETEASVKSKLSGDGFVSPSSAWAYARLAGVLGSGEDRDALVAVVQDFVHVALHSALVAVDGGSASAEVGRVQLVDEAGESLGEGLHELFVDHLFDTGRME